MTITRNNYEVYFIDYIDGKLPVELMDELQVFLNNNPDLKEELESIQNLSVKTESSVSRNWDALLKTDLDQPDVFEESCIRYIEDDLSEKDKSDFDHYLSIHPEKLRILELYKATVSQPDLTLVFNTKNRLQKKVIRLSPVWYSAAAVIVIGMVLWFLPDTNSGYEFSSEVVNVVEPIEYQLPKAEVKVANGALKTFNHIVEQSRSDSDNQLVAQRTEIERLEKMESVGLVAVVEPIENVIARSIPVNFYFMDNPSNTFDEAYAEYIAKYKSRNILRNFGRGTLNALRNVTNNKFDYQTNDKGELAKIEYNSRLLAFNFNMNSNEQSRN